MRIFRDFTEAYWELERELRHNGLLYRTETVQDKNVAEDDDFLTKELLGYTFLVKDPNIDKFIKDLNLDLKWIKEEFKERTSEKYENPGEAYKLRPVWEEFVHDGKFSYTYSERIGSQIEDVIVLLKEIPTSRHGIINIYDRQIDNSMDRRRGLKRVPCSMYYMLFNRLEDYGVAEIMKTHMLYNIRSNDFSTHFPYDLVLARLVQEYVANRLGTLPGDFIYQSGSLHVFAKDKKEIF
jgi:thymidylate synthase